MAEGKSAQNDEAGSELPPRAHGEAGSFSERELRVHVPADVRDVSFPLAVRGYDRAAVEAYVERVNHLIAELEISRSPRAAVRHALDRAQEDVSGILQRAQETAEEITASARKEAEEGAARTGAQAAKLLVDANDRADRTRTEAEEVLAKAKAEEERTLATARAEAEEILSRARAEGGERLQRSEKEIAVLRDLAEARMRDLRADAETVWENRRALLDDMSGLGARLTELASEAAARFPTREPGEQQGVAHPEGAEPEPGGATETDASARPLAEIALHDERSGDPSEEAD